MNAKMDNASARIKAVQALACNITAGSNDGSAIAGDEVNKITYNNPNSAKLILNYIGTISAEKDLSIAVDVYECDESEGTYTKYTSALACTQIYNNASTENAAVTSGVLEYDVNLSDSQQYIKVYITPDLGATETDTLELQAAWALTGAEEYPYA